MSLLLLENFQKCFNTKTKLVLNRIVKIRSYTDTICENQSKSNLNIEKKLKNSNNSNDNNDNNNIKENLTATPKAVKDPPENYNPKEFRNKSFTPPEGFDLKVFRSIEPDEYLGPCAHKDAPYKNPEYYAYHKYSHIDIFREALKFRECGEIIAAAKREEILRKEAEALKEKAKKEECLKMEELKKDELKMSVTEKQEAGRKDTLNSESLTRTISNEGAPKKLSSLVSSAENELCKDESKNIEKIEKSISKNYGTGIKVHEETKDGLLLSLDEDNRPIQAVLDFDKLAKYSPLEIIMGSKENPIKITMEAKILKIDSNQNVSNPILNDKVIIATTTPIIPNDIDMASALSLINCTNFPKTWKIPENLTILNDGDKFPNNPTNLHILGDEKKKGSPLGKITGDKGSTGNGRNSDTNNYDTFTLNIVLEAKKIDKKETTNLKGKSKTDYYPIPPIIKFYF